MKRLCDLKREKRGRVCDKEYDRFRRKKANPNSWMLHMAQWQKVRAIKLANDPLCERCKAAGRIIGASEVHHKVPVKDSAALVYDLDNLESLCSMCHNVESQRERRGGD